MTYNFLAILFGILFFNSAVQVEYLNVTTEEYKYTVIPELIPDNSVCGEIQFEVAPSNNVFVGLLSGTTEETLAYEIAIGLGYYKSCIRREMAHLNVTEHAIHQTSYADPLWISWNDGIVELAKKSYPSWTLSSSTQHVVEVNRIAVASSGIKAVWNFTGQVMRPAGCNIPTTTSGTVSPVTSSEIVSPVTSSETVSPVTSSESVSPVTSPETMLPVTTSETVSPFTSTKNQNNPYGTNQTCFCPCSSVGENKWQFLDNLTIDEIKIVMKDELDSLKSNLTIDKKNTSAFLRTKTSAVDNRPVSVSIGAVGVVVLISVAVLLMGSDCVNIINFINNSLKHKTIFK